MSIHESLIQTDDAQIELETTADVLKPTLNYGKQLVDELKLHVDSDGMRYESVDPANVAYVAIDVPAEAFESYRADETVIGLNLKTSMKALRAGRKRQEDAITLSYDNQKLSTTVQRDYDGVHMDLQNTFSTIDPDSIRQEPEMPDLDLPVEATIPRTLFEDVVDATNAVSDHIQFESDDGDLLISGKGDTKESAAVVSDVVDGEGANSIFSLDYFTSGVVDALKTVGVDEVTLQLGEDFPVIIEWETELNGATVTGEWLQAPRVTE